MYVLRAPYDCLHALARGKEDRRRKNNRRKSGLDLLLARDKTREEKRRELPSNRYPEPSKRKDSRKATTQPETPHEMNPKPNFQDHPRPSQSFIFPLRLFFFLVFFSLFPAEIPLRGLPILSRTGALTTPCVLLAPSASRRAPAGRLIQVMEILHAFT